MTDSRPLSSPQSEVAVLSAMLNWPDAVPEALEQIRPKMFFHSAHQVLFQAMVRLSERGTAIDVLTLKGELEDRGHLEKAGGLAYVADLLDAVPTGSHVGHHAQIVRERAQLRALLEAVEQIREDVLKPSDLNVEEILDQAESRVLKASTESGSCAVQPVSELISSTMAKIREAQKKGGHPFGLRTGFPDLDRRLGGLRPGELFLLASRPSMGKTALSLNIARNVAKEPGTAVAFFSLEQSAEELSQRLLASEARLDSRKIQRGSLSRDEMKRLHQAEVALKKSQLLIDDNPGRTVMDLRAKARRLAKSFELGLIVVDYLQLLAGHRRTESREQEVAQISQGLKALAKELHVPVMALSQLSRAPEKRANHRPRPADLRDSGSLEQDADVVAFIYRPEHYMDKEEADELGLIGAAEIIIAKHRNGPTGRAPLIFRPEQVRFDSISPEVVEAPEDEITTQLSLEEGAPSDLG